MATEDDMKRCAEAGVALAGAVARRAKEAAELLFGARHQAGREAKQRAGRLAKDAKSTAADVVAGLRRELSALLVEMEHLEGTLRGGPPERAGTGAYGAAAAAPGEPVAPRTAPESAERGAPPAPAPRRPAATRKASTAKGASPARKAAAARKVSAVRKVPAVGRKAPTQRGSAPRRTRTNRTSPPPGQG